MAVRKDTPQKKDKKIFRNTAITTKKINLNPSVYRGGIRL